MTVLTRPVLSRDAAIEIGKKVFAYTSSDVATVDITHTAIGTTRTARNVVRDGDDGDEIALAIISEFGLLGRVFLLLNQIDDATIKAAVEGLESVARQAGSPPMIPQSAAERIGSREYPRVALWHDSTVRALHQGRHDLLARAMEPVAKSACRTSMFVAAIARSRLIMTEDGLTAFGEETDAELTVTAWDGDGVAAGSGWAGVTARDWTAMAAAEVTERALRTANRSRNPVALEPGRYTAILSADAVAQLMHAMAYAFDALDVNRGQSPFSDTDRPNKIGKQVMDSRITISSDPADPDGGYMPFFPNGGLPYAAQTWIEQGMLKEIEYGPGWSAAAGKRYNASGGSFRMAGGTSTVEEMIASCDRGIYVTRFTGISQLDARAGMLSGTTANGCFLVQRGKLEKPIKNFRFVESPFLALNNLIALGATSRRALGYTPPTTAMERYSWPIPPIIAPPIMVRDFNFVALADAV